MAFSYLTEDNLYSKYEDADDFTGSLTKPFPEFERIAGNKPNKKAAAKYSDVTDGTTASIVRKLGKRIVQQLPTGGVESDDKSSWLPIVAEFIYTNKILPYAVLDYDLIQKCWQAIERGATYGSQLIYTPFVSHDGEFTSDMSLPYWADVKIPKGSKSGSAMPYIFLRTWWQEDDFDSVIDREERLAKQAKERGEKYQSTWDIKNLKKAKKEKTVKNTDEQDTSERDRNLNPQGTEVVTGFQIGSGAIFYTFVPSSEGDKEDVLIIRRKKNKDPRGKMPLDWYYNDTDGFNPLGRSIIDLIGPLQNLIDSDMQMYQWNRALMLNPPMLARGISKRKIVYAPGAIIDAGNEPNADVSPLKVDTSAVVNYPDLYGLQKSQILNLTSSPDTSISADVGNPGFGKTPTALNMQQQNISVDDNYVRKNFEAMWENWSETAINVYFAERTGKEDLQLDDATAQKLRKLAEDGKFDLANLSDENIITIDYDTATPVLKFRVDASTSKMKEDAAQSDILKQILDDVSSNPLLAQLVPQDKVLAVYNRLVTGSAVENPEELTINIDEFKKMQEQQMQQQAMAQTAQQQMQPVPAEQPAELPSEQSDDMDAQIADRLRSMGVPDETIGQALDMLDRGYSPDEVIEAVLGVYA